METKNDCVIVINLMGDFYYYSLSDKVNPYWTTDFNLAFVFPTYEMAEIIFDAHVPRTQFSYDITRIVRLADIYG